MVEVSALMSVYNGERYVVSTIDTILNQTFQDFEFIIVNDGSNDKTQEILESYKDPRIKLYSFCENKGVGAALQFGLEKAQGKYIAKVDADDLYDNSRFEKQKVFLDNNPEVALVCAFIEYFPDNDEIKESARYKCFKEIVEKQKQIVTTEDIQQEMYKYYCLSHTTMMVRSEAIKKFGYKDWRIAEDYCLAYTLNKHGYKMYNIPEVLAKVRMYNVSTTATTEKIDNLSRIYDIKREEIYMLFESSNQVYIWGCGSFGRNVLKIFQSRGLKVKGFIDSNPKMHSSIVDGLLVYSPDILRQKENNYKIIVASQAGKFSIEKSLMSLGYKHLQDYLIYL